MAMIRGNLEAGTELTPDEIEVLRARIRALKDRPIFYDEDCPELTDEQLAEFRPVNGMTMEERYQEMREAGIVDPELRPEEDADPSKPAGRRLSA
ncbi:hypothetical protein FACS1894172_10420 [Spirochaetia bacterium]|nr:hypothetical protein FACS1894164_10570 [Spirochaetia bacterium]GHU32917.1 hypothetical protein FACS1894172_10420 [Spirochaetia bacterium]